MKNKYVKDELAVVQDINEIFNVIPDRVIQTPFFSDELGLPTSDPRGAVSNIPFEDTVYRLANNDDDFEIVFEMRFNKSKRTDRGRFLKRHIKAFSARKKEIEQFNAELFDGELDLIERYIAYLKTKKTKITAPVRTLKEVPIEHQLPDNIYDLFKFVGIDLNLVMIEMTKTTFGDNDLIFVQRNKENQLKWNIRGRNGCIMIISALIMHLSDILRARPELKYTDSQLISSFTNSFNYINMSSICPTRAKEDHRTYVTKIIKAAS